MNLEIIGQKAKAAEPLLQKLGSAKKNQVLKACAKALVRDTDAILAANDIDMTNGKNNGMPLPLQDRLKLTPERIEGMAEGLLQLVDLEDPIWV